MRDDMRCVSMMVSAGLVMALYGGGCGGRITPPEPPDLPPGPTGPTGPTGPAPTPADIAVTSDIVSDGVRHLGVSFVQPMGADDPDGEFEALMRWMGVSMVRVHIRTEDVQSGRIRRDMERVPLEDPQLLANGRYWHSRQSRRMDIDRLVALGVVPYINILDDTDMAGGELHTYMESLAGYVDEHWPGIETWWAWRNEPFLHHYGAEEYVETYRIFHRAVSTVIPSAKFAAPDVQSDRVRSSAVRSVIRELSHTLDAVSYHGLYSHVGDERGFHFENAVYLMDLIARDDVKVFDTEWFLRRADMDEFENAMSTAVAYYWQSMAGVHASLMFGLTEGLWWNVGTDASNPQDRHWYGAVRIDNDTYTVDRLNRTAHVLQLMHEALGGGSVSRVDGPPGLLLAARVADDITALVIINLSDTVQRYTVDMGRHGVLEHRRWSEREPAVLIGRRPHSRGYYSVQLPAQSVTVITVSDATPT